MVVELRRYHIIGPFTMVVELRRYHIIGPFHGNCFVPNEKVVFSSSCTRETIAALHSIKNKHTLLNLKLAKIDVLMH